MYYISRLLTLQAAIVQGTVLNLALGALAQVSLHQFHIITHSAISTLATSGENEAGGREGNRNWVRRCFWPLRVAASAAPDFRGQTAGRGVKGRLLSCPWSVGWEEGGGAKKGGKRMMVWDRQRLFKDALR